MKDKIDKIEEYFKCNPEFVCKNLPERNKRHYNLLKSAFKIVKKQQAQLARLDDVEGLAKVIVNSAGSWNGCKRTVAEDIINYIKGE